MQEIRETDFALFVISDAFLKSRNCLYELLEFIKETEFKGKFLPVVLDDVSLRPVGKAQYIKFWKEEYQTLLEASYGFEPGERGSIDKDLKHYKYISMEIGDFLDTLSDMCFETYEQLEKTDFKPLFDEIEKRKTGLKKEVPTEQKKQIKILAITAAPHDDLYYEREQNVLIDAFRSYGDDWVFLDMPDPVRSTLTELDNWGKENTYDIVIISAHGSKDGTLSFEDEKGNPVYVNAGEIVTALGDFKVTPKIVIFSSCHSARKGSTNTPSVAQAIFESGTISCVMGMQKEISKEAVIDFDRGLLQGLLDNKTIDEAFETGVKTVAEEEAKRLQDKGKKWPFLHEDRIPELLIQERAKETTIDDFSEGHIEREKLITSDFKGAKYLDRSFVGRRKELRELFYRILTEKESLVTIKGPGGVGKSSLTTRTCSNLKSMGYELIVFVGTITVSSLFQRILPLLKEKGIERAQEILEHESVSWQDKTAWLFKEYITKNKVAIILDNFEDNQNEATGVVKDLVLKEFLDLWRETVAGFDSVLLITTRYTIPALPAPVELGDMKGPEARKLFFNYKSLYTLNEHEITQLLKKTGSNPRLLDLLVTLSLEEYGTDISLERISALISEAQEIVTGDSKSEDYNFTPWFIGRLVSHLSEEERELLKIVSLFQRPVQTEVIHLFYDTSGIRKTRQRLIKLSLLYYIQPGWYGAHRLTAEYVQKNLFEKAELMDLHKKIADYFANKRNENNKIYIEDYIEAVHHYKGALEYDRAYEIMSSVLGYLRTHGFTFEALHMVEEFLTYTLIDRNRASLLHSYGILLQSIGEYDPALEKFEESLEIAKRIEDVVGESRSLHQIGMIYELKGSYDPALAKYEESLEIAKRIGDVALEASTLHQIGMIYHKQGSYDSALEKYEESLEIVKRIGDVGGKAITLHQIGMIYHDQGSDDSALAKYEESLEIKKRIGDAAGEASTLHQIGMIYHGQGSPDEAFKKYEESLEIAKRIRDLHGIASSYGQLGILSESLEKYPDSLNCFTESYLMFKKIGSPNTKQALSCIVDVRQHFSPHEFESILNRKGISLEEIEQNSKPLTQEEQLQQLIDMYISLGEEEFVAMFKKRGVEMKVVDQILPVIKEMVEKGSQ